jgi:DNA-nicking Smr family endonuclease
MRRPLKPEEKRLWAEVAATVRLAPGRTIPEDGPVPAATPPTAQSPPPAARRDLKPATASQRIGLDKARAPAPGPEAIEPLRRRRLARARDEIGARLDLHGLDQDRARAALHAFLRRAHDQGLRAVLVITGKGALGDGVLRRRAPDWLAEPAVRPLIAGVSPAARRHGGEGALYIALKRRK